SAYSFILQRTCAQQLLTNKAKNNYISKEIFHTFTFKLRLNFPLQQFLQSPIMKILRTQFAKWLLGMLLLVSNQSLAQAPSFTVYLTNETATPNTYSFDIWVQRTGAETFELANC